MMNDELRNKLKEILNADTVNALCQISFKDEFNTSITKLNHEQLSQHITDLQDLVRVLQSAIQANMMVDEEWNKALTKEQLARKKAKDREYDQRPRNARPSMHEDGTKVERKAPSKDKTERLIESMMRTGMTRENAMKLIAG